MRRRSGNPVHVLSMDGEYTGCGKGLDGRRRSQRTSDVTCAACKASDAFRQWTASEVPPSLRHRDVSARVLRLAERHLEPLRKPRELTARQRDVAAREVTALLLHQLWEETPHGKCVTCWRPLGRAVFMDRETCVCSDGWCQQVRRRVRRQLEQLQVQAKASLFTEAT